jgi:hypothetical protein
LALGKAYAEMMWCSDAVSELERALHDKPELRTEPDLTRGAVACLRTKTQSRAIRLLEEIGPPAIEPLRAAAAGAGESEIRKGAERALERIAPK